MLNRKKSEIELQVDEDLKHISRGINGSTQNWLREYYNGMRRNHIANTQKTKEETLKEAIDSLKKEHPDFKPIYDRNYFKL